jgi:4-hydroxyphenylpyruvate dioxygenase
MNPLDLKRIHHVRFYVGNAKQAAFFYRKTLGFSQQAYAGLETGVRDETSYLLAQGNIRFVFTSPLVEDSPAGEFVYRHGDGVRDIAFEVADADAAYREALTRGAESAAEPHDMSDSHGTVRRAAIRTYGDTIHSFISLGNYGGTFLPRFRETPVPETSTGLVAVDHIVGNVTDGQMNATADWYKQVLDFSRYISFDDKDISTEYSALRSVVMANRRHAIKFPINEPAPGKGKSQIQEYIDFNGGPGVQHIAMSTGDIVKTVRHLRDNGLRFLDVPDSYYELLPARVGPIDESIDDLRDLGILVDRDDEGYLLQIFTMLMQDRPTLFLEVIQRKGCRGFGKGNFKALFESIEREQKRRGNL